MILYFLLLPDILSALTISVDSPHSPCRAAHPARARSPQAQRDPGSGARREPLGPGHSAGSRAGAALTRDEPHGPDPRPHQETEPASQRERGAARARCCSCPGLLTDPSLQGPLTGSQPCPQPCPQHSLVAGAGARPRLHLVQLVHVVLLRGQARGGRGRRRAGPARAEPAVPSGWTRWRCGPGGSSGRPR